MAEKPAREDHRSALSIMSQIKFPMAQARQPLGPKNMPYIEASALTGRTSVKPGIKFIALKGIAKTRYTISLACSPFEGGSVTGNGTYNLGESATVTAKPANGFTFRNWTTIFSREEMLDCLKNSFEFAIAAFSRLLMMLDSA